MPTIQIAEQAGVGSNGDPRPTEDHVLTLDDAVLLLDGATAPSPEQPPGGWYAGLLGKQLADELGARPDDDLGAVLARAIAEVAKTHDLRPGSSPSSTVAMLRWNAERVDALVLADSPIVAFGRSGHEVLADGRIAALRAAGKLYTGADVRARRNAADGFWVAEADPAAAGEALRRSWPRDEIETVLLASDGVAVAVDDYGLFDWHDVRALARAQGLHAVLEAVRVAERGDPHGARWPRAKRHDDQALVLVEFAN
ncbi:hypothetical protein HFP15_19430 [Amycolatopsis sp. K13G38]|uniref:Protein phosphatase 2C domain-containing protein n=1 Tax=Amycolatopsis acididurans TaxID=2724524 RepID=A0ABX1J5M8_9PSEU|nr:hypothetical protein [Amycolatopsis acididurans]NKQ55058.1 hypothetical protein [Amycolatopsis acididurans]